MTATILIQLVIAVATSVLAPSVVFLFKAISRLNETITRLEVKIESGVEPRIAKCESDIDTLYDRTNRHGEMLTELKMRKGRG